MQSFFRHLILYAILFSFSPAVFSQENKQDGLFMDNYQLYPENNGLFGLSIDNLSFFKNNESDGDIFDGYSLPGFRFQPRVYLYPTSFVKLEAGVSLLKFWGAEKYPCYAYQNIAEWKADNYQYGFHILPFFRAQIQPVKQINLVLGNLYGGSNHQLIEPLYNPELNLTADPECGIQFLYNSPIATADLWINWESFTFKKDTHNEAFTLGTSAALNITPESSFFHMSLPFQMLGVHRGGEIDTVEYCLTTMINAATGLNLKFNTNRLLKDISLQLMVAGYNAPKGEKLFYTKGWAIYPNISATIWNIKLNAGWWRSSNYINIFGNPVFENISLTLDGRVFPKTDVLNGKVSYEQPFGNGVYLGADMELFYNPQLKAYNPPYDIVGKYSKSLNYSFGVYLRINPSIVLSRQINK